MNPVHFTKTLEQNMLTVDEFENQVEFAKTSAAAGKPGLQQKIDSGRLCLGVNGDRLVIVNYGDSWLSSLIESIKHIFNGVRVGKEAVEKVKSETLNARMEIRAFNEQEKQRILKEKNDAAFEASLQGKAYNAAVFAKDKTVNVGAAGLNAVKAVFAGVASALNAIQPW